MSVEEKEPVSAAHFSSRHVKKSPEPHSSDNHLPAWKDEPVVETVFGGGLTQPRRSSQGEW